MKQIKIRFEKDRLLPHIEITIRSKEQDDQVNDLIQKISSMNTEMLMITDINNVTYSISFDSIILFSIEGKQLNILTEGDNYTVYQSLQSIERLLDPISLYLDWFKVDLDLLIMLGMMTIAYVITWVIIAVSYRSEVKKINAELHTNVR